MINAATAGLHYHSDRRNGKVVTETYQALKLTYEFRNFFHPFVGELLDELNRASLNGMLDPKFLQTLIRDDFFTYYEKLPGNTVAFEADPKKVIDLDEDGPYANYNWELLFHIPLAVAVHLSKNQRFAEAQRWFHFIFDPTSNEANVPTPDRYWRFFKFREPGDTQQIDQRLAILSKPANECSTLDLKTKALVLSGYMGILEHPFQPHRVARTRTLAYRYNVVMKYLDNLIAWGDYCFAQFTRDTVREATSHYVLAANILGHRPDLMPESGTVRPQSFADLKARDLDAMGNALVELEASFPFNIGLPTGTTAPQGAPLFGIGRALYFCIPRNERMLQYWDTVGDRLFKVRHCMNLQGVVQQLALFDPPIDPGMLVKAAASGIDVNSIVNGLNQPIGPIRSQLLIQKALELASEVRGLGSSLLSALEKRDSEHLALLRQGQERQIQAMQQDVRFLQWKQSEEAITSLLKTRASALDRIKFYQRLLGITPDSAAMPETFSKDAGTLTEENFDGTYSALVEKYDRTVSRVDLPALRLSGDTSPAGQGGASGPGKLYLNAHENTDLNVNSPAAVAYQEGAQALKVEAGVLGLIPQFPIDIHFWGMGGTLEFGGVQLSKLVQIEADVLELLGAMESHRAASASKTASLERRADEWILQHNLAARELMQLGRQLISSRIAEQIARHEYETLKKQIEHSQEVDDFLRSKFTTEELYSWMQGEISRLYYEYYRFAVDTARKAERTMKRELMRPEVDGTDFVKFNYWDGGRRGLLSGEALYLDVKRMDMAYQEQNTRELEMTRHISLRQLDPLALLRLKTTCKCEVTIPEWLFVRDCPGLYMQRIKSVAVSLPSVSGPYTAVNCKVSLVRSEIRVSPTLSDDTFERQGADDERFVDYYGLMQSVVTSGSMNDGGLFETNLRDERFLPFEGAGAVGTWRLELPKEFKPFDYRTLSDVIVHLRYTARQGGGPLAEHASTELRAHLQNADNSGLSMFMSMRSDFSAEWAAFSGGTQDFSFSLRKDYFPYFVQEENIVVTALDLYAANGSALARRTELPASAMNAEINGGAFSTNLSFAADSSILKRDARDVFLVVRYHI